MKFIKNQTKSMPAKDVSSNFTIGFEPLEFLKILSVTLQLLRIVCWFFYTFQQLIFYKIN